MSSDFMSNPASGLPRSVPSAARLYRARVAALRARTLSHSSVDTIASSGIGVLIQASSGTATWPDTSPPLSTFFVRPWIRSPL